MPSAFLESVKRAVVSVLSTVVPAHSTINENSPFHYMQECSGIHVQKAFTITGSGLTTIDLFTVVGVCRVKLLEMKVGTVADATTCTGFKFELDDGTAQTDITGGVSLNGTVAGSLCVKDTTAAGGLVHQTAAAAAIEEPAANKQAFQPFHAIEKTGGVATVIRCSFTGDGATDIDAVVALHYVPFDGDTDSIVAV